MAEAHSQPTGDKLRLDVPAVRRVNVPEQPTMRVNVAFAGLAAKHHPVAGAAPHVVSRHDPRVMLPLAAREVVDLRRGGDGEAHPAVFPRVEAVAVVHRDDPVDLLGIRRDRQRRQQE